MFLLIMALAPNSAVIGVVSFTSPNNQLFSVQNEKRKLSIKKYSRTIRNAGKDIEKLELPYTAGNGKWCGHLGK